MDKPFALFLAILILVATGAVALGGLKQTSNTQENVLNKVESKADRLLN